MKNYLHKSIVLSAFFFIHIGYVTSQITGKEEIKDTLAIDLSSDSEKLNKKNKFLDNSSQGLESLSLEEKKLFGFSLFQNKGTGFAPNLNMATPKNYIVGPGDVLIAQIFGLAQKTYEFKISNEGKAKIEDIGLVTLSGLSLDAVKALLIDKFSVRYSGLKGNSPSIYLDVSLSEIRSISVNLIGEINKPGSYTFPSYTTVFNALYSAGGPTLNGTFRNIQIFRSGKLLTQFDVYDFLVNGYTLDDVRLEDNDVILVKPANLKVEIAGEVVRPGIYELKENETISDLIKFTSGFSNVALLGNINLARKEQDGIKILDILVNDFPTFELKNGDYLTVNPIPDRFINRVQITGSINRPGVFELFNEMSLYDLIEKAGGFKGDAFLDRVFIYRSNENFSQDVITLNLNDLAVARNIRLKREDVVQIKSQMDFKAFDYVKISGEVFTPGVFPFSSGFSLNDLIIKGGGLKYGELNTQIEVVRKISNNKERGAEVITITSLEDIEKFSLKPFDHVFVRTTNLEDFESSVTVNGEVNFAGQYLLDSKELKISDLIARSGGLTAYAYPKGATLLRKSNQPKNISQIEKELVSLTSLLAEINRNSALADSESNRLLKKSLEDRISNLQKALSRENLENVDLEKVDQQKTLNENRFNSSSFSSKNSSNSIEEFIVIDLEKRMLTPGGQEDILLREGDVLNIPEKLETVKINGGVLYPLSIKFNENLSYMDYIRSAGGYDRKAIKNRGYVALPNGKIKPVSSFLYLNFYPRVEPGSEIFVPSSTLERPPFNYVQTVQLITSFVTTTLAMIFVFRSL